MGRPLHAAGVVLGVAAVLSLAGPEPAEAVVIPNPLDPIGDVLGAGAEAVAGEIPKLAVKAFGAIIKALFAWPAKLINRELLSWLVAVPDYAIHPDTTGAGRNGSNLAQLGATTSAMAFAALGAVGTVATIRFWAAGLTGSGGFEALEGLARTVGAALFIVLWPWLFRHCAEISNAASAGLLGSGSVIDDTSRLLALAFAAGVTFNILAILIAMAAAILFLGLLLVKIAVSMTTAVVFVGVPLAVMLWPIPELAWIARTAMRAFATVLVIPLAWALCFATFAAVGIDAVSLKGAGKFVDTLVMPLVAIALLWLSVVLPNTLARLAMFGSLSSGGFISRAVSYVVARRADAALIQALPVARGGLRGQQQPAGHGPGQSGPSADIRPAIGDHSARGARDAAAHRQRAGGSAGKSGAWEAARTVASVPSDQAGGSQSNGWKPPEGFEASAASPADARAGAGLRNPSWQEIEDHVPIELQAAAERQATTTRRHVAGAMRALTPDTQRGVLALMESKGGQIRGQMAHQAARADVGDEQRDAFRILAAATPETRAQGITDFLGAPAEQPPTGHGAWAAASAGGAYGTGSDPGDGQFTGPVAPIAGEGPLGNAREATPPAAHGGPEAPGGGSASPPLRGCEDDRRRG